MKLFVATPMFGGVCAGYYTQSLLGLQQILIQYKIDAVFKFIFNDSIIVNARNMLVHEFLKTDCTHLLFIDADMKFHAPHVMGMLSVDKSIICGIYPKKEINWQTVHAAANQGVPPEQLKTHSGSLNFNLINYQPTVDMAFNQPYEIEAGGTGFMLIKRRIFDAISVDIPTYNKEIDGKIEQIGEYFALTRNPKDGTLFGEDYHFCHLARSKGIKIWAAPWAELGHFGNYLFEGGLTYK